MRGKNIINNKCCQTFFLDSGDNNRFPFFSFSINQYSISGDGDFPLFSFSINQYSISGDDHRDRLDFVGLDQSRDGGDQRVGKSHSRIFHPRYRSFRRHARLGFPQVESVRDLSCTLVLACFFVSFCFLFVFGFCWFFFFLLLFFSRKYTLTLTSWEYIDENKIATPTRS